MPGTFGKRLRLALAAALVVILAGAAQAVRIKDLARVYGPMENPLVGYGLVVGLSGTGDDAKFAPAIRFLSNLLSTLGDATLPVDVKGTKNVAVVMVSATLPASNKMGDKLDVDVTSVGNASSLAGGTLVVCELGVHGQAYAIASGGVKVEGTFLTKATITGGATVVREVPGELAPGNKITFKLLPQNADYSIANRIVEAIHQDLNIDPALADPVAHAVDEATIEVKLNEKQIQNPVAFISRLERLSVPGLDYDMEARVVIDEKKGTFYALNGNVEISPVTVGFGSIQLRIRPRQGEQATTVDDLVDALDAAKATPTEVIGIVKALEAAGALHAQVIRQ